MTTFIEHFIDFQFTEGSYTLFDINEIVRGQLPRTLGDVEFKLASDPYHVRTMLHVKANGQEYETILEGMWVGTRTLSCKIPELFLARLCAECP